MTCPGLFLTRLSVLIHTDSMAAAHDKRTDEWASPEHFQRYGHRYAAKIGAEIQREESRQWTVQSKEEPKSENEAPAPSTMLTKDTKDEEARSVLPRGSVIQQNITKLASIATRSTTARTVNPTTDGGQTSAATRFTILAAKRVMDRVMKATALQPWRG